LTKFPTSNLLSLNQKLITKTKLQIIFLQKKLIKQEKIDISKNCQNSKLRIFKIDEKNHTKFRQNLAKLQIKSELIQNKIPNL